MNHERRSVKLSEIVFSEPLYPRKGHDPALVQRYAGCMDEIEARGNLVALSTDLTLLDGRHRHLAYLKLAEGTDRDIPVFIYPVQSDEDKFALAVRLNSEHGCQLSTEDKRRCVEDLYAKYRWAVERIAAEVSVRKQTALDWTRTIRENEEKRENEAIFDLWMSCHTQEQIAYT